MPLNSLNDMLSLKNYQPFKLLQILTAVEDIVNSIEKILFKNKWF